MELNENELLLLRNEIIKKCNEIYNINITVQIINDCLSYNFELFNKQISGIVDFNGLYDLGSCIDCYLLCLKTSIEKEFKRNIYKDAIL